MTDRHRRISLLVVEDDPDQRSLVERHLEEMDLDLRLVATGEEAVAALEGVDLVLLDYHLPGMTGIETLQAIRASDGPSVIMVTGKGSESVAVEALRNGAIDYVIKDPTYFRDLPEVIERGWRQHDLIRRAGHLQKLTLLVSEAEERGEMLSEIVNGARELLGAEVCAVAIPEEGNQPSLAASTSAAFDLGGLMVDVQRVIESRSIQTVDGHLLVPLTKQADEAVGVLIVAALPNRAFDAEEVQLAETFASFGAIALRKLRQRELEQALFDELQKTLELRRDFINGVSHELRTPLACISGFSTTLITHWDRLDQETMLSSLEKINHHAADLAKLVDALLDFGLVEHGGFAAELERVQLKQDVEGVVGDLQPLLADRLVKTDVADVAVLADRTLLKRVFINLFSNSVKASEPGSTISVTAAASGDVAEIQVIDEGVGLSVDELGNVFDPFWRSRRSVKGATRGAGIGLTLVREYVRSMRGDIRVDSRPGEGATFTFTIPLAEGHQDT